jgi:predicted dehydrogenase
MRMRKTIGVGLIGTGYMAKKYLEALSGHARWVALLHTQRSTDVARQLQKQFDIPFITQSIDSLLNYPELEAVLVCSPNATHYEHVAAALSAKKQVFCEKPLCISSNDGLALLRLARSQKRILAVGMNCRFRDQYAKVYQLIQQGTLGRLFYLRGTYIINSYRAFVERQKEWWLDPANGHFFLNSGGIHCLDLLQWIGGPIARVSTASAHKCLGGLGGEDTILLALTFGNGTVGELFVCSVARRPNEFVLEAYGDKGTVLGQQLCVEMAPDRLDTRVIDIKQPVLDLVLQFQDFLNAIHDERPPLNTAEMAIQNLLVCEAADMSIATGQSVCLQYPPELDVAV